MGHWSFYSHYHQQQFPKDIILFFKIATPSSAHLPHKDAETWSSRLLKVLHRSIARSSSSHWRPWTCSTRTVHSSTKGRSTSHWSLLSHPAHHRPCHGRPHAHAHSSILPHTHRSLAHAHSPWAHTHPSLAHTHTCLAHTPSWSKAWSPLVGEHPPLLP